MSAERIYERESQYRSMRRFISRVGSLHLGWSRTASRPDLRTSVEHTSCFSISSNTHKTPCIVMFWRFASALSAPSPVRRIHSLSAAKQNAKTSGVDSIAFARFNSVACAVSCGVSSSTFSPRSSSSGPIQSRSSASYRRSGTTKSYGRSKSLAVSEALSMSIRTEVSETRTCTLALCHVVQPLFQFFYSYFKKFGRA